MIATGQSLLYVSTALDTWETSTPETDQDGICERCGYRRLDPEYYAWLRYRMTLAQKAYRAGRLRGSRYEELRARFNAVHAWALARLGEERVLAAVQSLDPKGYRPPTVQDDPEPALVEAPAPEPHFYPPAGDWPFTEPVSPEAVAMVDAIREQALSLGWSEAALYRNRGRLRFPNGGDYGLVCYWHGGRTIGEVTAQSIEIVCPSGSRLRYYNREVQQPWLQRTAGRDAPTDSDISPPLPVCNPQENE